MLRICENCIHNKVCNEWAVTSGIPFVNANTCENFMTSDVVPRAELAVTSAQQLAKIDVLTAKVNLLEATIDTMKDINEHLAVFLEETRADVAREIFEEIKICLECEYMAHLKAYDYTLLTRIEELKKKYTEGE